MNKVGILKTNLKSLYQDVERLLGLTAYKPRKEKILLKPNIVVAAAPEDGDITHPGVVEALVRYFQKRDLDVVVGEGTGIFSTDREFENLLRATGYDVIRDRLGVPVVNLEQVETEKVPWRYGSIPLPRMLKEYEYINVPTMKTHLQTTVTIGVKNQKGLIPMKTKKLFHKKDLHARILELSRVIQPALTVVDGIYCIEGTGPTGPPIGEVKAMNLLVAGQDMMAVDNVCVEIMGFRIHEIKHLEPVKGIRTVGERIGDVRSDFKKPTAFFKRDRFIVHMDEKACTMCTVSFYKALSKMLNTPELKEELMKRKDLGEVNVILGPTDLPSNPGTCTLCLGDCSTKTARENGLPRIEGCHPDYREIVNFFFPGTYDHKEGIKISLKKHL